MSTSPTNGPDISKYIRLLAWFFHHVHPNFQKIHHVPSHFSKLPKDISYMQKIQKITDLFVKTIFGAYITGHDQKAVVVTRFSWNWLHSLVYWSNEQIMHEKTTCIFSEHSRGLRPFHATSIILTLNNKTAY